MCDADSDLDAEENDGNANGQVLLIDLVAGEYTVEELTAPNGYLRDETVHSVTVIGGEQVQITIVNMEEANPQGDTVFLYKLNCLEMPAPGDLLPENIALGVLPDSMYGCSFAPGVTFEVATSSGVMYETKTTDGTGRVNIWVPDEVTTIYLTEDPGTNPGAVVPEDPFVLTDLHSCECNHTNRVIVNILVQ